MRPGPSQPCVQGLHGDHKGKPGKNVKASVSPGDAEFSLSSPLALMKSMRKCFEGAGRRPPCSCPSKQRVQWEVARPNRSTRK